MTTTKISRSVQIGTKLIEYDEKVIELYLSPEDIKTLDDLGNALYVEDKSEDGKVIFRAVTINDL